MRGWLNRFASIALVACVVLAVTARSHADEAADPAAPQAKYVFFFIGDGMGPTQRDAAEAALRARSGDPNDLLVMNRLAVKGDLSTHCITGDVTDSAAAGTALATGSKTANGIISMTSDGKTALKTLAEVAKERAMKTGILSSVSLDHATPACFYAHTASRSSYAVITVQMLASRVDYFAGGGLEGQRAADGSDNLQTAAAKGFTLVRTLDKLRQTKPSDRVYAFNHRLGTGASLPWACEAQKDDVPLAEFVREGIRLLDNDRGFFMMVEGGKIDWACHSNDLVRAVHETLALDDAVAVAVDFSRKHPRETLIIVTADHETGGLQRLGVPVNGKPLLRCLESPSITTALHTLAADKAPVADVLKAVQDAFSLGDLSPDERKSLEERWGADPKPEGVVSACHALIAARAGYRFSGGSHTGVRVPLTAAGVGSQALSGQHDNTDIFGVVRSVLPQPQ